MHCKACDKQMTDAEIQFIPDTTKPHGLDFDLCAPCLTIAFEAAYCGGFVRQENTDEVETLDEDDLNTELDELDRWLFQPEDE